MNVKQYLRLIKQFFGSHALINTTVSGNQFNFNILSKIVYPIAHVEYLRQNTDATTITQNFLVTIADIHDPNLQDSEEDIYSDTAEICNDAITYFGNQIGVDYTVTEIAQIEKFNNGLKDRVCGSTFILSFTETREANDCIIPIRPTSVPLSPFQIIVVNNSTRVIRIGYSTEVIGGYPDMPNPVAIEPGVTYTTDMPAFPLTGVYMNTGATPLHLVLGTYINDFTTVGQYAILVTNANDALVQAYGTNILTFTDII